MIKILSILLIAGSSLHGLIHLMGFTAYWPLAKINELPYKTSVLQGRWELGAGGMKVFAALWLLAAVLYLAAAVALGFRQAFWAPLMLAATLLSLALCVLDWEGAFRGAWIDVGLLVALGVVFGLRAQPAAFPAFGGAPGAVETAAIPAGLPAPVDRFYRQTYGEHVPVIRSAVLSGRGSVRFMGITFPARLRFTHVSGYDYRHYIEATFWGMPLFKVNEHYIGGQSRLNLPFGVVVENEPKVNSAANQGLWAEMGAYPEAYLTDPRVRWEAVDATNARLVVPFGDETQTFTIGFDTQRGALTHIETLRYRDVNQEALRWWGDITWPEAGGGKPQFAVTWEDEGTPWLIYQLEEAVFNADLGSYVRQTGP